MSEKGPLPGRQIAPVDDSDRVKAMTAEQLDTFLSTAERMSARFHPLYLAGARTGMRLGELWACGGQHNERTVGTGCDELEHLRNGLTSPVEVLD